MSDHDDDDADEDLYDDDAYDDDEPHVWGVHYYAPDDALARWLASEQQRVRDERERMSRPHAITPFGAPCRMCMLADGVPWVSFDWDDAR